MPIGLGKQCQPGSQQGMQPIFVAAFAEDPSLCPLLCLQQYEEIRPKDGSQQLLIATVAPHKPVASSTIVRWLKEVLNASVNRCGNLSSSLHKGGFNICSCHGWCYDPDHHIMEQAPSADITAIKALTAIQQQHSLKLCWTEGKGKSTNIQGHVPHALTDWLIKHYSDLAEGWFLPKKGCLG